MTAPGPLPCTDSGCFCEVCIGGLQHPDPRVGGRNFITRGDFYADPSTDFYMITRPFSILPTICGRCLSAGSGYGINRSQVKS